jgi:hypothetical protein
MMKHLVGSITDVHDSQRYDLGYEYTDQDGNNGVKVWIYVKNDEAATALAAGEIAARKAATASRLVVRAPVSAVANRIVGVASHEIPAQKYGFIVKRGITNVIAGAETIDVDEPIAVSGTVGDEGLGAECGAITTDFHKRSFGYALANAADTVAASCYIDCRG